MGSKNNNNRVRDLTPRGTVATHRSSKQTTWVPPATLAESRLRKQEMTEQLFDIEARLASRNVTDVQGRRLTGTAYWSFREQLIRKKMGIVREIQRLKAHISQLQTDDAAVTAGLPTDVSDDKLLLRAYKLLQQLKREDVDFDASELAFFDVLGKRLGFR